METRTRRKVGRSAGVVSAKKVKGKKAKRLPHHDQTLHEAEERPAAKARIPDAAKTARVTFPPADPDAEHVGRLPLGPDALDRLRAGLHVQRSEALRLAGVLERNEAQLEESERQSVEEVERGTDLAMESTLLSETEMERGLIEESDAALARMDAGKYGVCEKCGDRIALARLLALPHARVCIRCARKGDRRRDGIR